MLRGGYGLFHDDFTADIFGALYGGPFSLTESFVNTTANNTPTLTLQRPFLGAGTPGNVDVTGLVQQGPTSKSSAQDFVKALDAHWWRLPDEPSRNPRHSDRRTLRRMCRSDARPDSHAWFWRIQCGTI